MSYNHYGLETVVYQQCKYSNYDFKLFIIIQLIMQITRQNRIIYKTRVDLCALTDQICNYTFKCRFINTNNCKFINKIEMDLPNV